MKCIDIEKYVCINIILKQFTKLSPRKKQNIFKNVTQKELRK